MGIKRQRKPKAKVSRKKPKKPKWTLKSVVISKLRQAWRFSPMRNECLARCKTGRYYIKISKKGNEYKAPYYKCEKCGDEVQKINVEHIEPVVALTGFETWDVYIQRLMVESSGLLVWCKPCHKAHTSVQTEIRKQIRKSNK